MTEYLSIDEDTTLAVGRELASLLPGGSVVALDGDLGCGKTVLSRGVARGLGILEAVTSPTFTVAQEYRRADGQYLYHLDMYRITDENAALAFGIDEFLFQPNAVTLVEWPERIAGLLEGPRLRTIRFRHLEEGRRGLSFTGWPDETALAEALAKTGAKPL